MDSGSLTEDGRPIAPGARRLPPVRTAGTLTLNLVVSPDAETEARLPSRVPSRDRGRGRGRGGGRSARGGRTGGAASAAAGVDGGAGGAGSAATAGLEDADAAGASNATTPGVVRTIVRARGGRAAAQRAPKVGRFRLPDPTEHERPLPGEPCRRQLTAAGAASARGRARNKAARLAAERAAAEAAAAQGIAPPGSAVVERVRDEAATAAAGEGQAVAAAENIEAAGGSSGAAEASGSQTLNLVMPAASGAGAASSAAAQAAAAVPGAGIRHRKKRGPGAAESGGGANIQSAGYLQMHGMLPGSKKRVRWNSKQDDALLRLVENIGCNWPAIRTAWQRAGLDNDGGDGAPERSPAAMRQRYYLLMGRRPGKKAPARRRHLDRWEVQDDLDMLDLIVEGGEGFGVGGTVDSACAQLSRQLNLRPHRPLRTDMSVYNRVRRLAMRKNITIYEFLGLREPVKVGSSASLLASAASVLTNDCGAGADGDGNGAKDMVDGNEMDDVGDCGAAQDVDGDACNALGESAEVLGQDDAA